MPSTQEIGDIAEAEIYVDLLRSSATVLEPKTKCAYDYLITFNHTDFTKVQVKNAVYKKGSVRAELRRTNMTSNGAEDNHYTEDDVDVYALYCPDLDECYYMPFDKAGKTTAMLRVDKENAKYASNINWAHEHQSIEEAIE